MSTSFHLCQAADLATLASLTERRRAETGMASNPEQLAKGLAPLCAGTDQGAAYLFGPVKAPVGYLTLTFSWNPDSAAPEATIRDLFIRPSVRRRGLATEAISGIARALRSGGIAHLTASLPDDPALMALAAKCGLRTTGLAPVARAL